MSLLPCWSTVKCGVSETQGLYQILKFELMDDDEIMKSKINSEVVVVKQRHHYNAAYLTVATGQSF